MNEMIIELEEADLYLPDGSSVIGKFKVESFEKNYGTFCEDLKTVMNIDCEFLFINNIKTSFDSLSLNDKYLIKNAVEDLASDKLNNYHY